MVSESLDIVGFLKLVLEALDSAGIEYMLGGAIAAWAWGEPRATQDIDLVVDIPFEAVARLSRELEARAMLVPPEIILDTLLEERADIPINAIHMYSGLRADLYPIRKGDVLRREAFQRRAEIDFGPPIGKVFVHSPEDLIIYKLLYYSISQQPKHIRDIAAILQTLKGKLDLELIETWSVRLGLSTIWHNLLEDAD
jgi:hypothetical protein